MRSYQFRVPTRKVAVIRKIFAEYRGENGQCIIAIYDFI